MKTYVLAAASALLASCVWAEGVDSIPNFHQVNESLYRGGQPTAEGWNLLARKGVRVVIDLRRADEHSAEAEERAVKAAGMRYLNVPMKGVVAPADEDIAKILEVLGSGEPVFVHCRQGKDRTGTVIACYRITHDRWDRQRALNEAKELGMHRIEVGMKRYIMAFDGVNTRTVTAEAETATATR